jgi:hypothetical protein
MASSGVSNSSSDRTDDERSPRRPRGGSYIYTGRLGLGGLAVDLAWRAGGLGHRKVHGRMRHFPLDGTPCVESWSYWFSSLGEALATEVG